jgi:hypothetical protein
MGRVILLPLILLLGTSSAHADVFFLCYDAQNETFPEQQGWSRYWGDPEDELIRSVDNGVFRLDTRGSYSIFDLYQVISTAFILDSGEELQVTWRMETVETDEWSHLSDVALAIVNQSHAYAQFFIAPGYVSEDELLGGEPEHLYEIQAGVPHTYLLRTTDMWAYDLYVDGAFAFQGGLHDYAWREVPRVSFGDTFTGRTSLSEWEYVEVEVVPEAASGVLTLASWIVLVVRGRR